MIICVFQVEFCDSYRWWLLPLINNEHVGSASGSNFRPVSRDYILLPLSAGSYSAPVIQRAQQKVARGEEVVGPIAAMLETLSREEIEANLSDLMMASVDTVSKILETIILESITKVISLCNPGNSLRSRYSVQYCYKGSSYQSTGMMYENGGIKIRCALCYMGNIAIIWGML